MKFSVCSFLCICILIISCDKEESPATEMEITLGKNYFTTVVDGDVREYYVHVPNGYDEKTPTPVVLMLHGGSGNGDITYRNSGWKELGEKENFISVFPTAWSTCWINGRGVMKDTTRWNSFPGLFDYCDGPAPRDDVKFLREVISELKENLSIDSKRIYMVGFSSGAQMTFRCGVEMSDLIAAGVQSGGTHQIDTAMIPLRKLPMALELGNRDESWFDIGMYPPMSAFDTLLSNHGLFQRIINVHAKTFGFETEYEISGNEEIALTATFKGVPDPARTFKFSLIDGLDHSYPKGNPFYGPKFHWEWMKQYSLP